MKTFRMCSVIALLTMAACAQQSVPEVSRFQGQPIQLQAVATPGLFDAEFVLAINGQTVIKDRTKPFGGSSQTFQGQWNGMPVMARATQVTKLMSSYVMVDVFINGQLVDTLTV